MTQVVPAKHPPQKRRLVRVLLTIVSLWCYLMTNVPGFSPPEMSESQTKKICELILAIFLPVSGRKGHKLSKVIGNEVRRSSAGRSCVGLRIGKITGAWHGDPRKNPKTLGLVLSIYATTALWLLRGSNYLAKTTRTLYSRLRHDKGPNIVRSCPFQGSCPSRPMTQSRNHVTAPTHDAIGDPTPASVTRITSRMPKFARKDRVLR